MIAPLLIVGLWLGLAGPTAGPTTAGTPTAGSPTAEAAGSIWREIEWTDLSGRQWGRDDLAGRVVVIDFWATWCPPCLAELPHWRRLHRRAEDDERLLVLGVALDTIDRRRLHSFLRRHGIAWPQVHERRGTDSDLAQRFAVDAVPANLVVDRAGRVVGRDLTGEALDAAIEDCLRADLTE